MAGKYLLVSNLLLAVTALCGGVALDYLKDDEFHQWVYKYHKDGENLAEIYPTWRRNADFVKQHNSQDHSFTVAVNKFAHLDVGDLVEEKHLAIHASNVMPIDLAPADIPASIDWREKGVIPPITNQGECGVSNLFACVDSIDALWAIKHGQLVLGSYEECIDCCLKGSCSGTYTYMSLYQCVVKLGGLARADQYKSPNHTCQSDKYPGVIKISGAASVTPKAQEGVLAEVVAKQPVVVTVDASHSSFQLYDQGVYYDPNCSSTSLDHSMLVVGYGTENGEDYWIVKNSWGDSWGMNGYVLMARNRDNNCGIASEAVYPY